MQPGMSVSYVARRAGVAPSFFHGLAAEQALQLAHPSFQSRTRLVPTTSSAWTACGPPQHSSPALRFLLAGH